MKPTFHIIEEIFQELKYDFICRDTYGNYIHIPKNVFRTKQLNPKGEWFELKDANGEKLKYEDGETRKSIKIERLEFPFFVLAKTKKFQNADKIKLVAFVMFKRFSDVIDAYESSLALPVTPYLSNDDYDYYLNCIKQVTTEYESYIRNKIILNHPIGDLRTAYIDKLIENESSDKKLVETEPLIILASSKIYPWFELLKEKFHLRIPEEWDMFYKKEEGMIYDWNYSCPYAISIKSYPLFTHTHLGGKNIYKGNSISKKKILTLEKFKKIDKTLDYHTYLHQFYYLNARHLLNPKKAEQEFNWRNYVREGSIEYKRRVYEIFKTPYVVQITPYWNHDIDKILLKNLHNQIERVATLLLALGITNLIISPPFNDINRAIENEEMAEKSESDYYEKDSRYLLDEISEQGMRELDDQDDGWWRIANDID